MDTKLKGSDFAAAIGINRALITIARNSGHLVCDDKGLYDYNNPKNSFWIKGQTLKGKVWDIGRISASKFNVHPVQRNIQSNRVKNVNNTSEQSSNAENSKGAKASQGKKITIEYESVKPRQDKSVPQGSKVEQFDETSEDRMAKYSADLQEEKMKAEIIKLKNHNILESLKIGKVEGSLLPVDAVQTLFLWAVKDFQKTYEQETDSLASIYIKNLGGDKKDFIEIKKSLMSKLSFIGETYKENLLNGLENAIAEYSEVRSRGERR